MGEAADVRRDLRASPDVRDPPRTPFGILLRLGPGVIIAGSIVGSGELVATTKVGAEAGFLLLWLILAGCVIKVFTQVEIGRHTITWGRTALDGLNRVPGPRLKANWIVWYWLVMTILVLSQQGGIAGGVGQALAIGRPLTGRGRLHNELQDRLIDARCRIARARKGPPEEARSVERLQEEAGRLAARIEAHGEPKDVAIWTVLAAVATSAILFIGRYRLIQTVSIVLVATFTVVTVVTLAWLQASPEWAVRGRELAAGLSFRLPPVVEGLRRTPVATALAAFGIIGVGAAELIMYPYWLLEKGYARCAGPRDGSARWVGRARGWIRVMCVDAWLSMVVYTLATVAFYLLGAAVLGRAGLHPEDRNFVRTLAQMYVPVFGPYGKTLFLFGAVAVLYSTFFVACAGMARIAADGLGIFGLIDRDEASRRRWSSILSGAFPLVALGMVLIVKAPVAMILASGVSQALMLPLLGAAALYFRYRRSDARLRPGRLWDLMLWLSFAGFLIVGGWTVLEALLPQLGRA